MSKEVTKRDIEFLFEIGTLRFIKRAWMQFLSPHFANLAEHHFRVLWLALLIARQEEVKDINKVLQMAMAHDIAESRTGDVHYVSRQYTERQEVLGLTDMLGGTTFKDVSKLIAEYEKRESIEARVVKDADNLEVDFELKEQEAMGNSVGKSLALARQQVRETKLYTKSAKQIWDHLQNTDPHDWHRLGRNRLNSGDWQK